MPQNNQPTNQPETFVLQKVKAQLVEDISLELQEGQR